MVDQLHDVMKEMKWVSAYRVAMILLDSKERALRTFALSAWCEFMTAQRHDVQKDILERDLGILERELGILKIANRSVLSTVRVQLQSKLHYPPK